MIAVGQLELTLFSFLINPMVVGLCGGGGRKARGKGKGYAEGMRISMEN